MLSYRSCSVCVVPVCVMACVVLQIEYCGGRGLSPESEDMTTQEERIVEGERIDPNTGCAEGDVLSIEGRYKIVKYLLRAGHT